LVRYIERGDTTTMLDSYLKRPVGWGLSLLTGKYPFVDSSKVASRYYVSTSPTAIANTRVAVSNGSNLVGYGSLTYTSSLLKLTNTTSASTIRVEDSSNANIFSNISPTGFFLSRASDGSIGNSGGFYKVGEQVAGISARTNVLLMNDTRAFLQVGSTGVTIERAASFNTQLTASSTSSILDVLSTTQGSRPFPIMSTAQANAITGVQGLFVYENGVGPRWYDGTRWNYVPKADRSAFTSTRVPFTNSSGQFTESTKFSFDDPNASLILNSAYLTIQTPPTGVNAGIRMTSSNTTGLAYLSVTMQPSNGATTQFFATNNAYPGYQVVTNNAFGLYHSGAGGMGIQSDNAASSVRFGIGTSGTVEKMRVDVNGVGIFTTPTQELDVNGDLRVRDSLRLPILSSILQTEASGWVKALTVGGGLNYSGGTLRTNIDTASYIKGLGTIGTIPIFSGTRIISDSKMVYNSGLKQIKYTGADFFVQDSIIGGVTMQIKNKAQGPGVTTGLVTYNQSDNYVVWGMSSNGYTGIADVGSNRGYIYTEADRGFIIRSLGDTSTIKNYIGGAQGRQTELNSVGFGINREATASMLEVAGEGAFYAKGNGLGVTYIGGYPATVAGGAPDVVVEKTGFIYNTNPRFAILSGAGFSVNDDIVMHVTGTKKVTYRGLNDTLAKHNFNGSTFFRDKVFIGQDSTFKFDPVTDLLHITCTARITGSTGTPTSIVGRDGSGNISNLTLSGLSIVGGTLTSDGNGIYTGSGTLASPTTRALVSPDNKLLFTQKYNSNADSTYLIFDNVDNIDGFRSLRWGLTDTVHTGGYAYGRTFKDEDNDLMGYETKTNDAEGATSITQTGGNIRSVADGNVSMEPGEDFESRLYGSVVALREAYNEVTSTTSPVTLSSIYPDNLINQGGTQATFTLNLPASPLDGQICTITYNNAISVLTVDGNGETIVGSAVTTGVPGSQRKFKFYAGIGWIKLY